MNFSIFLKLFIANLHKDNTIMIDSKYKHLEYMLYRNFIEVYSNGVVKDEFGLYGHDIEPNKYLLTNFGKEELFKHEYTTLTLIISLISIVISLFALFSK